MTKHEVNGIEKEIAIPAKLIDGIAGIWRQVSVGQARELIYQGLVRMDPAVEVITEVEHAAHEVSKRDYKSIGHTIAENKKVSDVVVTLTL